MNRNNPKPNRPQARSAVQVATPSRSAEIRYVIALVAVCLVLGLVGIRWALPDAVHQHYSFHPDETTGIQCSVSILTSDRPLFPTVWAYEQSPFFFYVAAAFIKVASAVGLARVTPNPTILEYGRLLLIGRLAVLMFFCGVVALTFLLLSRMWGQTIGLLTALLTAASPIVVTSAHFFKNDIPLLFFILLTLLFAVRIVERGRTSDYVWAGILCGISAATKWHGLSVFALVATAHFLRKKGAPEGRHHGRLLLAAVCAFGGLLVAVPGVFLHPDAVREGMVREFTRRAGSRTGFMTILAKDRFSLPVLAYYALGLVPSAGVLAAGAYLLYRRPRDRFLQLLLPFTGLLLLLFLLFRASFARYYVPAVPFLMAVVGRGLLELHRRGHWWRPAAIGVGTLTLGYSLVNSLSYVTLLAGSDPRVKATDWLNANAPARSVIAAELNTIEGYDYVDPAKYQLLRISQGRDGDNRDTAALSRIDYYVASEAVYRRFLKLAADLPQQRLFYQRLMNGTEFVPVWTRDASPHIFGLRFSKGYPPDDMMYYLPGVTIYQRTTPGRTR